MALETLEGLLKDAALQAALSSPYWSDAEAERIVTAFRQSGLSVKRFAEQAGISRSRLYLWLRRLAEKGIQPLPPREEPPQFVSLCVQRPEEANDPQPVPQSPPAAPKPPESPPPRPLGLRIRFYRSPPESPSSPETFELEFLFPPW